MMNINTLLFDKTHIGSATWRFPSEDIAVTVSEMGEKVKRFAMVLKKNNIGEGDRIGFILDNSYDLVCLLFATWYLNAVAVPLRTRSGRYHKFQDYLGKCDEVCGFKLVVFEGEPIADEMSLWSRASGTSVIPIQNVLKSATKCQAVNAVEAVRLGMDDLAVIQFSSGSTGDPKGVVVTHGMMMAQLQNIEDNHARSRGRKVDSSASWLPINHDMGLFIGVLSPVFSACDNLLSTPAYYMKNPPRWFGLLSHYCVDFTFSTNSVLASSLKTLKRRHKSPGKRNDLNLSNLHIYIAAEKVSPIIVKATWDGLSKFGCPTENIHIGYGMAENTLGATYTTSGPIKMHWFVLNSDDSLSLSDHKHPQAFELASIGIPNDHHRITVRDRNDAILPELVLGEFSIESPCVSPAYYNNPEITELKLGNGRLRTGDLGFLYKGEFYFYTRVDDLIISGGRNVVPDDIEATVETLSSVRIGGSALLGVENPQSGMMQLHLLVEANACLSASDIASLRIAIRQQVLDAHDLLIINISLCTKGTIEKTSSGKKRRKVIRQRLMSSEISLLPQDPLTQIPYQSVQHKSIQDKRAKHEYQPTI
jgi:fatty-acyl-CoA synthase